MPFLWIVCLNGECPAFPRFSPAQKYCYAKDPSHVLSLIRIIHALHRLLPLLLNHNLIKPMRQTGMSDGYGRCNRWNRSGLLVAAAYIVCAASLRLPSSLPHLHHYNLIGFIPPAKFAIVASSYALFAIAMDISVGELL